MTPRSIVIGLWVYSSVFCVVGCGEPPAFGDRQTSEVRDGKTAKDKPTSQKVGMTADAASQAKTDGRSEDAAGQESENHGLVVGASSQGQGSRQKGDETEQSGTSAAPNTSAVSAGSNASSPSTPTTGQPSTKSPDQVPVSPPATPGATPSQVPPPSSPNPGSEPLPPAPLPPNPNPSPQPAPLPAPAPAPQPQTTASGFGGTFQVFHDALATCRLGNPLANGQCACPSGYDARQIHEMTDFHQRFYQSNGAYGMTIYACHKSPLNDQSGGFFRNYKSGGCADANYFTGTCSCPSGFSRQTLAEFTDQANLYWCDGQTCGYELTACYKTSSTPGVRSGGFYRATTTGACFAANPLSGNCFCPAGFHDSVMDEFTDLGQIYYGGANVITHACWR